MILLVAGTRPEIVKLASVYVEMNRLSLKPKWLWTNQQPELGMQTFASLGMKPEFEAPVRRKSGGLMELMEELTITLRMAYEKLKPDLVMTQGDTLTTAVASQLAFLNRTKLAHVEAGLRSWDITQPWPEEACRIWVDSIADLHFCPTAGSALNVTGDHVYVTGNTGIDATRLVKKRRITRRRYAMVTMHRRENALAVTDVCLAIRSLVRDRVLPYVVWPVHPNPIVSDVVPKLLGEEPNVELMDPVDYATMVNLVRHADLVLTDSGGLQEECLALSTPCLVMRETTERPEGVECGGAKLVGADPQRIVGWATWLMENPDERKRMRQALNPYGDGKAGQRIALACEAVLDGKQPRRKVVQWAGVR